MSRTKVANREATVVLLDVGASMCTPLRECYTKKNPKEESSLMRFAAAVTTVQNIIQQKLFFKPKDEIGIVVYGSEDTDNQLNEEQGEDEYTNVVVLSSIDTPTLQMCERLKELKPTTNPDTKVDILDGLIVALDLLFRRTEGKKYESRLLVITDAAAKIADTNDLEAVMQMIQNMGVKLQVVGLDFVHTTEESQADVTNRVDTVSIKGENEPMKSENEQIKEENEKILVSIAKEVGGEVCSVSKRMQLLAQGMKKTVMLTTKFRGYLEIGNDFGIPVYCYLKTKIATLPTLAKESQVSYEKETGGKVKMDRRYTSPQNPDEEVVPDQQVKAYRYGMEKVPFSSADVEFFKLQTEKSLKVLGFLDRNQLNKSIFVAGTDVFIAEPGKPHAAQCLAALIEAMVEMDQVAIARFVPRKNAAPKIVGLIPHKPSGTDNYYCLWTQQLPFAEDVRNYEFASLTTKKYQPTEQQQDAADKLVDSLSVRKDRADDIGTCFNPILRRFFNSVEKRVFDETAEVASLPEYVDTCLKMDKGRQLRIQDLIQSFSDAFQLKEAVKKQSNRKKMAFWSDIGLDVVKDEVKEKAEDRNEDADEVDQEDGGGSDGEFDLDELLDSGDVTSVGSMNPIADFETLIDLSKNNRQRLITAVTDMEKQIENFFTSGSNFFPKAIQTLVHFRKRSVELQYSSHFNEFFTKFKAKLDETSKVWQTIVKEGITLLSTDDDPSVNTTPVQARIFLYGEEQVDVQTTAVLLSSQAEAMENENDMFADFE